MTVSIVARFAGLGAVMARTNAANAKISGARVSLAGLSKSVTMS